MSAWAQRLDNPVSARLRDPAATGYAGILLGVFAAFLCIPPLQARTITWPIVVGAVAVAFGIWTVTRGRTRLGWGAVASGAIGIGLGILATRSGTGNLNTVFDAALIAQTFAFATPLVFGALLFGTTHGLTSNVIQPELAGNLTYIIQGLVVLFIGADVLILYVWNTRRKLRPRKTPA